MEEEEEEKEEEEVMEEEEEEDEKEKEEEEEKVMAEEMRGLLVAVYCYLNVSVYNPHTMTVANAIKNLLYAGTGGGGGGGGGGSGDVKDDVGLQTHQPVQSPCIFL